MTKSNKTRGISLKDLAEEITALKRVRAGKGSLKDRRVAERLVKFMPEARWAFPHLNTK